MSLFYRFNHDSPSHDNHNLISSYYHGKKIIELLRYNHVIFIFASKIIQSSSLQMIANIAKKKRRRGWNPPPHSQVLTASKLLSEIWLMGRDVKHSFTLAIFQRRKSDGNFYGHSRRSVPCGFEDHLKIDFFHDWMIIQTLFYFLPPFHSNVASFGWNIAD